MARFASGAELLRAVGLAGVPAPGQAPLSAMRALMRATQAESEGIDANAASSALMRSTGAALPDAVRTRLEAAFGHDLAHVRVHTDAAAAEASVELHALAFTLGAHVFFGPNQFDPTSTDGLELLAHELMHVVQHDERRLPGRSGPGLDVSSPTDAHELEAVAVSREVVASLSDSQPADAAEVESASNIAAAPQVDVPASREPDQRQARPGAADAIPTTDAALVQLISARGVATPAERGAQLRPVVAFLESLEQKEKKGRMFDRLDLGATHAEQLRYVCFSMLGLASVRTAMYHALFGDPLLGLFEKSVTEVGACRDLYRYVNGEVDASAVAQIGSLQKVFSAERKLGGAVLAGGLVLMLGPLAVEVAPLVSAETMTLYATRPLTMTAATEFVLGTLIQIGEGGLTKESFAPENLGGTLVALLPSLIELWIYHTVEGRLTGSTLRVQASAVAPPPTEPNETMPAGGTPKTYKITSVEEVEAEFVSPAPNLPKGPGTSPTEPLDISNKVKKGPGNAYLRNDSDDQDGAMIMGQPGSSTLKPADAAREVAAAELVSKQPGVALTVLGDAVEKEVFGTVGKNPCADALGVMADGMVHIAEAKGMNNIQKALTQIESTANRVGPEKVASLWLVVPEKINDPPFRVQNGVLLKYDEPYEIAGQTVNVTFTVFNP